MTATIRPSRSRPAASSSGIVSRGPQSGQAIGSAWKRRSPGSSYSRRQAAQSGKPAIVVRARSYGTDRHDREARAAVRAVDERIAVAAIGRVEELAQAVVAGRGVRGHERRPPSARVRAEHDREPGLEAGRAGGRVDARHTRERRRLGRDRRDERGERARLALGLDDDAVGVVEHEPGDAVAVGQPVHEGTEADALDDATHPQAQTLRLRGPRLTHPG